VRDEHREEETPTLRIMGRIFAALALPILILVALLLNIEDKSLPMIGLLLGVGGTLFTVGLIIIVISCLPQEKQIRRETERCKRKLCS
jgi:nitrate/nitrite transporter NarK